MKSLLRFHEAVIVSLFTLVMFAGTLAVAQTETVLYSFPVLPGGLTDGNPYAGPILDSRGNLYGTTVNGGAYNHGSVFELSRSNGLWVEKDLHSFNSDGKDGVSPYSSLAMDPSGNLYGTTYIGGGYNLGTVFELHPNADGSWTEKVLHSFNANGSDGCNPYANLIFDKSGNLYGTTYAGGNQGAGTVFELSRKNGVFQERVILRFDNTDGSGPYGGLVFDLHGNLYGTTQYGGTGQGVVFRMTRGANGVWSVRSIYNFSAGAGGWAPYAGLVIDKAGNLYGTTIYGGNLGSGTVFELASVQGKWRETVIHNFGNGDGLYPYGPLALDSSGNLYGTTWDGALIGNQAGAGIVFELSQTQPSVWQEKILHNFVNPDDRGNPYSGVAIGSAGNVYGTTYAGGVGGGIVFEITP